MNSKWHKRAVSLRASGQAEGGPYKQRRRAQWALGAGGAGAADAVSVTASGVAAPATDVAFGAIHKNPATVVVGADFQVALGLANQGVCETAGDCRYFGRPAILRGLQDDG